MGKARISVMEDDVLLPPEHLQTRAKILHYLDRRESTGKPWDIFVGVIAQLREDTIVSAVERFEGLTFVTINRMTSMVYNIYNQKAMKLIGTWDETNTDAIANTIDRFLESQSELVVLTTLEPLFGHREDAHSTLWGFKNTQYTDMISETRIKLRTLVDEFERSRTH
jgi:flavin-binding protein dodecin